MQPTITKTDRFKFTVAWLETEHQPLELDFEPIITQYNLKGVFCLLHWQAVPKKLRQWGVYDNFRGHYYSGPASVFIYSESLRSEGQRLIDLDESLHITRPTSVLYYDNAYIKFRQGFYTVCNYP